MGTSETNTSTACSHVPRNRGHHLLPQSPHSECTIQQQGHLKMLSRRLTKDNIILYRIYSAGVNNKQLHSGQLQQVKKTKQNKNKYKKKPLQFWFKTKDHFSLRKYTSTKWGEGNQPVTNQGQIPFKIHGIFSQHILN